MLDELERRQVFAEDDELVVVVGNDAIERDELAVRVDFLGALRERARVAAVLGRDEVAVSEGAQRCRERVRRRREALAKPHQLEEEDSFSRATLAHLRIAFVLHEAVLVQAANETDRGLI